MSITGIANVILPLLLAGLVGLVGGAVINYCADILPVHRKLKRPECMHCHANLTWWNYLAWPRKCPVCRSRRSRRTWIVELVFAALSIWIWFHVPEDWTYWASMVLLVYLGLVTVVDIEHRLILHSVSITGGVLGLALGTWQHGLWSTLIGGAVGFAAMLGLYWLGMLFLRFQKRRQGLEEPEDALGFGDVNLSGVIGLLLGWPGILAGLVFAILLAGGFSLVYLILKLLRRQYQANLAIPYGPFLVASAAWLLILRG